jgi:hypothetical protein
VIFQAIKGTADVKVVDLTAFQRMGEDAAQREIIAQSAKTGQHP